MKKLSVLLVTLLVLGLLLAACGPTAEEPTAAPVEQPTEVQVEAPTEAVVEAPTEEEGPAPRRRGQVVRRYQDRLLPRRLAWRPLCHRSVQRRGGSRGGPGC